MITFLSDMFKTLDERLKRILLAAGIFLLVFLICYKIIYQNATNRARYYRNRTQEAVTQNNLREELQKLDSVKESYETLIIQKQDIDIFKNELSKMAMDLGIKVLSISSKREPAPANYNAIITTIDFECGYHQLGNFISKIENAQPYIEVISIALGNQPQRPTMQKERTASNIKLAVRTYGLKK